MAWHLLLSGIFNILSKNNIKFDFCLKRWLETFFIYLKLDLPNLSWFWTIWHFKDTYIFWFILVGNHTSVPTVPPLSINSLIKCCLFLQLRMFFELFFVWKGSAWNASCILDSIQLPTGQLDLNYAHVRSLKWLLGRL